MFAFLLGDTNDALFVALLVGTGGIGLWTRPAFARTT
jgi:hypothetical protein